MRWEEYDEGPANLSDNIVFRYAKDGLVDGGNDFLMVETILDTITFQQLCQPVMCALMQLTRSDL